MGDYLLLDVFVAGTPVPLPAHIIRNISVDARTGCWLWTRSRSPDGYGWASLNNHTHQAHRLVYRLTKGEPPAGTVIDHLCRVRHCVNPDHMEPVENRENLRRGDTPTGWQDCQRCGGQFTRTVQQRRCQPCQRQWKREYMREYRASQRGGTDG